MLAPEWHTEWAAPDCAQPEHRPAQTTRLSSSSEYYPPGADSSASADFYLRVIQIGARIAASAAHLRRWGDLWPPSSGS